MKSLGTIIRSERLARDMTIMDLERETKIRSQFLIAIEKQSWHKLPDYPVLQGFVRSIARALNIDENKLVAFLRRDYPPKQLRVFPKPDVADKFRWSPRLSFFAGALVIILLVVGYLVYQYFGFVSPPKLVINTPTEGQKVTSTSLTISGSTSQDATVKVNNQPFVVDEEGNFEGEIELTPESQEIEIKALSRAGKESIVKRKIQLEINK